MTKVEHYSIISHDKISFLSPQYANMQLFVIYYSENKVSNSILDQNLYGQTISIENDPDYTLFFPLQTFLNTLPERNEDLFKK